MARDLPKARDMKPIASRREVLNAGGGLVAATVFGSIASSAWTRAQELELPGPPPKKLGWAVVGLGKLAIEEILPAFAQAETSRVTALVSGDPAKARKVGDHYGVEAQHLYDYERFDELANDPSVDVVYIVLPNSMHAEFTIRALRAGKHVLCEKPMATSVEECERMISAAKEAGKKLMIAYRLHHEPFNQKAIELARTKPFGKINLIEAVNYQDVKPPNIRLVKALGGGALGDVGVYCINAGRYLLGEEPVEAVGMHRRPKDDPRFTEVAASTTFELRYPSGVTMAGVCGFDGAESRRYRVHCAEGWFELDPAFSYRNLRLRTFDGKELREPTIEPVDHFAKEMDHFSECVIDGMEPKSPGEQGLADMRIIAAIERSTESGRVERV